MWPRIAKTTKSAHRSGKAIMQGHLMNYHAVFDEKWPTSPIGHALSPELAATGRSKTLHDQVPVDRPA
jgi:hypothetical protein